MKTVFSSPASVFMDACKAQGVTEFTGARNRQGIVILTTTLHRDTIEWDIPFRALDAPLDINAMPDIGPVRMLGALANVASGYDEGVSSKFEIAVPSAFKGHDGFCPSAERYWDRTLQSLTNNHPPLAEVYVDDNDEAVAIRKGRGAIPTVMLLQSVRIVDNGKSFTYLPGSLVHLSASGDETRVVRHGASRKLTVPGGSIVRPWSDVTGMNYLRQTPLAYNDATLIKYEANAGHISVEQPWQAAQALAYHIIEYGNRE